MEDKLLIWKLNRGSKDALCSIYEKYRDDLVRIAAGLLNDVSTAEDLVQEVFLILVRSADKYEIKKNLKGYLTSCVVNKIRNLNRTKSTQELLSLNDVKPRVSDCKAPDQCVICDEEFRHLYDAIARLPYEQKEAVFLGLVCGITGLVAEMPLLWFLGDSLSCLVLGILILLFWQKVKVNKSL